MLLYANIYDAFLLLRPVKKFLLVKHRNINGLKQLVTIKSKKTKSCRMAELLHILS
jgi:hypothetical protein